MVRLKCLYLLEIGGRPRKRDASGLTQSLPYARIVAVETDNPGSLKLLEKLGFEVVEIDPKNAWPEAKGGGFRECATLKRGRLDGKE